MENHIRCCRCVLDTTVSDIEFDERGICNYCHSFDSYALPVLKVDEVTKEKKFRSIIDRIIKRGEGDRYDCILGLSGGVDSSYMMVLAKENNLRPLVVHFDNGWNSELAVANIEKLVSALGYDLYTHVIDWESFKDLQLSYLKASVVDIEVPTDQLIFASLFSLAKKFKIKTILSGANVATESIMPTGWNFMNKGDYVNLKNIHTTFGKKKLKKFPTHSYYQKFYYKNILQVESVSILDHIDYSKKKAKEILMERFSWKDYGGKHYESVFTRFYQGYILPVKFNIDKRKAHLSSLILSGEITREEALEELAKPTYPIELQKQDKEFVLKKFDLNEIEFDEIMKKEVVPHSHYGLETDERIKKWLFDKIAYFVLFKIFHPLNIIKRR